MSRFQWMNRSLGVCVALLMAGNALAEPVQRHVPLSFDSDSGPAVRTSICAEVTERLYGTQAWWKADNKAVDEQQHAFQSVLDAVTRKDAGALEKLASDSGSQHEKVAQQLRMMLEQSSYLSHINAVRMYEVDQTLIVFAQVQVGDKSGLLTLVFAKQSDRYLLLPVKPRNRAYSLLRDWANSPWGVLDSHGPGYCASDEIGRSHTRVTFSSGPDSGGAVPIAFNLIPVAGKAVEANGAAARILATFTKMKDAAQQDQFERLLSLMSPPDVEQLRIVISGAEYAGQRAVLKQSLVDQNPVAVVDGGPLLVLYTRATQGSNARVWYFTLDAKGASQWAKVSQLSQLDPVFKTGPLFEAARSDGALQKLLASQ